MNYRKISEILQKKLDLIIHDLWNKMQPKDWAGSFEEELDRAWVEYLNKIDCIALSRSEILEELDDIINYSSRGKVCIDMGEKHAPTPYVLIPSQLAELILVLDGLPEKWSA